MCNSKFNARRWLGILLGVCLAAGTVYAAGSIYDFTLPSIEGKAAPLAAYKGKVLLLVNVASQCGYTPQYEGLEAIYKKYKDRGLVVLGFPANNFGAQEPGTNQEIQQFCKLKYGVTFPMYAKVSVKGEDTTPLYRWLTKEANQSVAGDVQWNFTKFLLDRNGKVVGRFEPKVTPEDPDFLKAIEKLL